jgi:LysM repeat protein
LTGVAGLLDALDRATLGVGLANLPKEMVGEYRMYSVIKGDTLRALAKRFYGSLELSNRIFDANRDKIYSPDRIYAGQTIRIPKTEA